MVAFFPRRVYLALVACPSKVERASAIGTRKTRTLLASDWIIASTVGADHRATNSDGIVTNEPGHDGSSRDAWRATLLAECYAGELVCLRWRSPPVERTSRTKRTTLYETGRADRVTYRIFRYI